MNSHKEHEHVQRTSLHRIFSKQMSSDDPTYLNACELKKHCYNGFSDVLLRPMYWKVFLDHYSRNKFRSELFSRKRRELYEAYAAKICHNGKSMHKHYELIENDVKRTFVRPRVHRVNAQSYTRSCDFLDAQSLDPGINHRSAIKRILMCYSIANSSIRYVQGMNFVVSVVYYVMSASNDTGSRRDIEPDTFFCFNSLMAEIGDNFTEDLDLNNAGISYRIHKVAIILKMADSELYSAMESKGLSDCVFCMRWILVMFASCFEIDDVVWLWDRLLSDASRFDIVLYCCASAIILMRNIIINNDFDRCMQVLQDLSAVDVKIMFYMADGLRKKHFENV
ncbi:putative GTPase-activating protein [Ordospora colligata OC4]|uniref:Putative GTPase-activating protein n=1 Tax=Ordospora colligata OC4 TaxID=1354746 RepID=A0A0B2UL85_9MICR|nr:putative GTPase-activating protein [Ordospora colligata OC4]KHN70128.1 putative GTPase-activating protein [Ordospora colligata OC4]TBU16510.1 putative GTPase-activating protein [Ordospora colligata]TBU16551.1 putative GTPase-activating protein [Ordospora colligata]